MAVEYPGNIPSNVNKDAKYSVRSGPERMQVQLVYRLSQREKALLSTDGHAPLVEMVNTVKIELTGQPGGAFYINEYFDVLVPTNEGCFFAGQYDRHLEFDFEGHIVGPRAPEGLKPGDPWPGPHVGTRYTLTVGAKDIRYTLKVSPQRTRDVLLSDDVGEAAALAVAKRLAAVKGDSGGRIYINEVGEFFAPNNDASEYLYLGSLGEDPWFDRPDVPED